MAQIEIFSFNFAPKGWAQCNGQLLPINQNQALFSLLGTTYGVPFGSYSYTTLLGPKWFDRVPLLIPLSWFTMSWATWIIACRRTRGFQAVLLGACLLVAWDLLLDPAMSRVTSYWIWGEKGSYYGMPWTNLLGWAMTGFILLAMLRKLAPEPKGADESELAAWTQVCRVILNLHETITRY